MYGIAEKYAVSDLRRSQCRAGPSGDREDLDVEPFRTRRHHLRLDT
jgi:hypothetical protein